MLCYFHSHSSKTRSQTHFNKTIRKQLPSANSVYIIQQLYITTLIPRAYCNAKCDRGDASVVSASHGAPCSTAHCVSSRCPCCSARRRVRESQVCKANLETSPPDSSLKSCIQARSARRVELVATCASINHRRGVAAPAYSSGRGGVHRGGLGW
jgi:hypothetical protein